jgi:sensor histidine kinase YesM
MYLEKEILEKENLQTQLNSLKEQINPHFLFNNLSSLSSLVMEDQHKAVTFINELSSVTGIYYSRTTIIL